MKIFYGKVRMRVGNAVSVTCKTTIRIQEHHKLGLAPNSGFSMLTLKCFALSVFDFFPFFHQFSAHSSPGVYGDLRISRFVLAPAAANSCSFSSKFQQCFLSCGLEPQEGFFSSRLPFYMRLGTCSIDIGCPLP